MLTLYYNQEFISKVYDATCTCITDQDKTIRDDVMLEPFKLDTGIHFCHDCVDSISEEITRTMIQLIQDRSVFIPYIIATNTRAKNVRSRNLYISAGVGEFPTDQLVIVQADLKELVRTSQEANREYNYRATHLLYPIGYDGKRDGFFTLGVSEIGKIHPVTITVKGGTQS